MRSRIRRVICNILGGSMEWSAARTMGSRRSDNSSAGMVRMCSALSHTALGSKGSSSVKLTTALERLRGKLGAIGRDQQGQVGELRRGGAGGFEDEHMLEGVGEMVLAADDVADAQVGVVGAGGQVVGGHAVAAHEREIQIGRAHV